jgi:hypothetical protein
VLLIGTGAGLRWELQQALQSIDALKLVLLIPDDEALYIEFVRLTSDWFRRPLPSKLALTRKSAFDIISDPLKGVIGP